MFLIPKGSWQVKRTKEKGLGVFARNKIVRGTVIGDYLGKVIKTIEYDLKKDEAGLYLMYLTDELSVYPDLTKPDVHLINHSCTPNCWIYIHQGHTLFFAIRDINLNEELTISYLLAPKGKCNPCTHICKCGTENCTGTMHLSEKKYEIWQKFQETHRKRTKLSKFVVGKKLPKLKKYPKILNSDPIYKVIKDLIEV